MRNLTCFLALSGAALSAQIGPGDVVVAVHLPGLPATQLLAVDLVTASWRVLPRFPADVMPPLAVAFDSVDNGLLLAVDAGGGISRVLRFDLRAGLPANERALADVPGQVTDLTLGAGQVLAAVDGPQGGIYALPRTGGVATLLQSLPGLAVLQGGDLDNNLVTAAWSAVPGPPPATPGAGIFDLAGSRFFFGPDNFTNSQHPQLTGSVTLPFPQPRLLLAHGDGSIDYAQLTFGGGAQPVGVPVQPVPPAGGANAMKAGPGGSPLVLGGSSYPMLWTFDPAVGQPPQTVLAGPLPGDPVDFALAPDGSGSLQRFGTACGPTAMDLLPQGRPTPGNVLQLQLAGGTANSPAVLVLGLSDQLGGVLPWRLPSGCELAVSPDVPLLHATDAAGAAAQALAIPNQNALIGLSVFTQWLQAPMLPFAVSRALSIRIGS